MINFIKSHKSGILTGLSVIGLGATTAFAIRDTIKLIDELDEAESKTSKEKAITTVSCYIPTILCGLGTAVCIIGTHIYNRREQASLIGLYGVLANSFNQYKDYNIKLHGREAHDDIIKAIDAEEAEAVYISMSNFSANDEFVSNEIFETEPDMLFYDGYSKRFFTSKLGRVLQAEYHVNRNFMLRGCVPVNEYYDFLGISHIKNGDKLAWDVEDEMEGVYFLDFTNTNTIVNGIECCRIDCLWTPTISDYIYY